MKLEKLKKAIKKMKDSSSDSDESVEITIKEKVKEVLQKKEKKSRPWSDDKKLAYQKEYKEAKEKNPTIKLIEFNKLYYDKHGRKSKVEKTEKVTKK